MNDFVFDFEMVLGGCFGSDFMVVVVLYCDFLSISFEGVEFFGKFDDLIVGLLVFSFSKVFGIGLNYWVYVEESGMDLFEVLLVFVKYFNCIIGLYDDVVLCGDVCDYEVEFVIVIGDEC